MLDVRDGSLGRTFAHRDSTGGAARERFPLGLPSEGRDILIAGGVFIDARGRVEVHAPAGLMEADESGDDHQGVNTSTLTSGQAMAPASLRLFGHVGESGQRAAGLFPQGRRGRTTA